MRKDARKIDTSIYQQAPDMLLNAIAEAEQKLAGQESSPGYAFWRSKVNIMRFALNYMEELGYILKENRTLKSYNEYLRQENDWLRKELTKYTLTEELIQDKQILDVVRNIEARGIIIEQEIKEKLISLKHGKE